jgi:hypothetical protein
MIQFDATKEDAEKIAKIVNRACDLYKAYMGQPIGDKLSLDMDITAAHLNGCPLDLDKLLAFPDFDFSHDVFGIQRHIDRKTGTLGDCFLPRCSKPQALEAGDVVVRHGSEGPKHDPYAFTEYYAKGYTLHMGLGETLEGPDGVTKKPLDFDKDYDTGAKAMVAFFEEKIGVKIEAIEEYQGSLEPDPMGCLADYE